MSWGRSSQRSQQRGCCPSGGWEKPFRARWEGWAGRGGQPSSALGTIRVLQHLNWCSGWRVGDATCGEAPKSQMTASLADPLLQTTEGCWAADPRGGGGVGLNSPAGVVLLVPSLQFGVCTWLKPDMQSWVLGESEHVTPASVQVVNSCVACLRQNVTEEGEFNSYGKE